MADGRNDAGNTRARAAKKAAKKVVKKVAKQAARSGSKADVEAQLAALPSETAEQNPNQPVAVLVATATRLASLAKGELTKLLEFPGFERRWVTDLPAYARTLTELEARWNAARAGSRAGITPKKVKSAEDLKRDLMDSARYVLRLDPEVQQALDQIAEGTGIADLAQDLRAIAELVAKNGEAFASDESLPSDAAAKAMAYADELTVGIDPAAGAEAQALRNRAFWLTLEAVDEVRAALRFHWRKQPTKLATLGVSYVTQLKRNSRARRRPSAGAGGPAPKPA